MQQLTQAEQSLREGRLQDALAGLQAQVRKEPANAQYRVFLFQLLAVLGQWERALNQLKVLGDMDPAHMPMAQTYREAIRCNCCARISSPVGVHPWYSATPSLGWHCCWKHCA